MIRLTTLVFAVSATVAFGQSTDCTTTALGKVVCPDNGSWTILSGNDPTYGNGTWTSLQGKHDLTMTNPPTTMGGTVPDRCRFLASWQKCE